MEGDVITLQDILYKTEGLDKYNGKGTFKATGLNRGSWKNWLQVLVFG